MGGEKWVGYRDISEVNGPITVLDIMEKVKDREESRITPSILSGTLEEELGT